MEYTPLHVHSDVSPDGAGTVQSLVQEAHRLGFTELALTDHGTLGNAVAFWSACQDYDIKPILGMEAYLSYKAKRYHCTLLSLNETGFNNLIHLDSWAHADGWSGGFPLINLDKLQEFSQGLFALTGCVSSALYVEDEAEALAYVGDLEDAMGKSNLALETMFLGTHDTWTRSLNFAARLNMPYVVTNDTHYPCEKQYPAHQVITQARRGYTYDSKHLWLKSYDEIVQEGRRFTDEIKVKMGLEIATMIGRQMAERYSLRADPKLPSLPQAEEQIKQHLLTCVQYDINLRGNSRVRKQRLRMEWDILKGKGFLDYIYILWDIVSWAKMQGIRVGPGRGSGGGSYVLYLLGITEVDPIEYGLMFERFINPARADYPDVDVDFEADRRDLVINYAHQKWGTIPIATYSNYSHKSAIHDIARVMKIPKHLEEAAADGSSDSPAFEQFMNYKADSLLVYETMLGQNRHRGKHAAGVIIPSRPVPIERSGDLLVAAWAEGMNTKDLSKVGIVKYDLLGLTALSQLKRMEELSGAHFPGNYDDPHIYDLFCAGDVTGIFQWAGSEGIKNLTMRIAPRTFRDLTVCNALYRPGALDAGTADKYPEYMQNPRLLEPRLDALLESTYGVICYQEQVMAVVSCVMGGDLSQADLARRLLSKSDVGNPKWEAAIDELYTDFMFKGESNGFDEDLLHSLWHEVYTHSGYSYNLSHATTYTMISYQMAWYKVFHRATFTVAMLQYDKTNAQTYIVDAVRNGLTVKMPDINLSTRQYELDGQDILVPLSDIAFLGEKSVDAILTEREKGGVFQSYSDFAARITKRMCNNRGRQMLERIGALSSFQDSPENAIDKYDEIPVLSEFAQQMEVLGYIIPSQELLDHMETLLARKVPQYHSTFAGFISKITKKRKEHGDYWVYYLSPEGSFWCKQERRNLTVGKFVAGTKGKFGHSSDVKSYKIG